MHVSRFAPLLAAAFAASVAANVSAQHLRVDSPLSLEEPVVETSPPNSVGDPVEPPVTAPAAASHDNTRPIGQPRRLLSHGAREGAAAEGSDVTGKELASGIFGSMRHDLWQVLSALAVVIGLAFTLRAALRRGAGGLNGGARPSGVVEILAKYPIARGQHLVLLKVARRILLVHHNCASMTTLTELSDQTEVAALLSRIEAGSSSPREASRFRSLLNQFSREHERASNRGDLSGIQDAWNGGEIVDLTKRRRNTRRGE